MNEQNNLTDFKEMTPVEERQFEKGCMFYLALVAVLIGVLSLISFLYYVNKSHSLPKDGQVLNLNSFSDFGTFISGFCGTFFSLAGVFLLYLTLKEQRDNFHLERLENNFFEMIKIHRENVSEMEYTYYELNMRRVTAQRRKVFKLIFTQFKEAWKEVSPLFQIEKRECIYEEQYLAEMLRNPQIVNRKIDLKKIAQIDIVYLIVFLGLGNEDQETIKSLCYKRYKSKFIEEVITYTSMKPKRESKYWDNWKSISGKEDRFEVFANIERRRRKEIFKNETLLDRVRGVFNFDKLFYDNKYLKYYGGHQFRLGHYFRHIYQSVEYITSNKNLTDEQKYNYVKILRGQLSNYEQIIFFLNSLSEVGRVWELVDKRNNEATVEKDKQLISRYNLIKNIPFRFIETDIDILEYYPDVKYESIISYSNL